MYSWDGSETFIVLQIGLCLLWKNMSVKQFESSSHIGKKVSMDKKKHNHTLQTNPRHHEDEPQNNNSQNYNTSGRQTKQSNQ